MSNSERDSEKDHNPLSKNVSPLNINQDQVRQLYDPSRAESALQALTSSDNRTSLKAGAGVMTDSVRKWGADTAVQMLREGGGGFVNGRIDQGAKPLQGTTHEYFDNVGRIAATIAKDPALLTDGRRVNIDTTHT
ncbi:MAG: hypothetical protein FJX76_24575 [Armatimonadetes bacterium]|nr:hypothetical protein [Armatimonadota bacterium]